MKKLAFSLIFFLLAAQAWAIPPFGMGLQSPASVAVTGGTISGVTITNSSAIDVNYTPPFAIGLARASAISNTGFSATPNYTKTGGCVETAGVMTCTGTGTFALNVFAPTSGTLYQVDIGGATETGTPTFTFSMGGVTESAITAVTGQNYRFYILASSTAALSVSVSSAVTSVAFTSLSILPLYDPQLILDDEALTVQNNVYLPAALAGTVFQSYNASSAPAAVVLYLTNTNAVYLASTQYSTAITLGAARQTFISIGCFATGTWDLLGQNGTANGS